MSVLSVFYRWAIQEGHADAEPFTYRTARALFAGTGREVRVNLAVRRTPKPHVTIKYLEPDFTRLFLNGLRGLGPDGGPDDGFRGRELARNAAVGGLALSTGLRLQEFSYLLAWEVPALPAKPTAVPIPFPVPAGVTKGRKFRTTWISYEALAAVHHYLDLDRAATTDGTTWRPPSRWGEPLLVTDPGPDGGRVNGVRRRWESLTPGERRRLVAPGGGSCVLAVKTGGGPFTAWATVFERTSDRIRARFEPRFPHVNPHRLRHSMAMATLEYLVSGHYRQAAALVTATDAGTGPDAALAFYLSKADPMLVLRDLSGPLLGADHGEVPSPPGHHPHLPGGLRAGRARARAAATADATLNREVDAEFADDADDTSTRWSDAGHRREDPPGIGCVFSDGSTAQFTLDGLPCPGLVARSADGAGRADPPARQRGRGRVGQPLRPVDPGHGPHAGRAGVHRTGRRSASCSAGRVLAGRHRPTGGVHPADAGGVRGRGRAAGRCWWPSWWPAGPTTSNATVVSCRPTGKASGPG